MQLPKSGLPAMSESIFEIIPHPRHPGDWLLKPCRGAPYGLWYGNLQYAISYAEWAAQDLENAEIRVYKRGGVLQERRIVKGSGPVGLGLARE
jgi:hypothetical protein